MVLPERPAQDLASGPDLGAAVTFNQFPDNSGPDRHQTFNDLGWTLSAARTLTDSLSIAGEVGISDNLMPSETTNRNEG